MKLITFKEVAKKHELTEVQTRRYTAYMKLRWRHKEELLCLTGYASEWAERFKSGYEYAYSDADGRYRLDQIGTGALFEVPD